VSNFPGAVDTFSSKVAHASRNAAADVNALQDSVVAIETELKTPNATHFLGYMPLAGTDTITGDKTFNAGVSFQPTTDLNGAIDNAVVSIAVDSAAGFANPGPFTVMVDSEKMRVTAGYGGTSWTVTRAYDGTQAAAHSDEAIVRGIKVLSVGTGDDVWYALGGLGVAQTMDIRMGSLASPITTGFGPVLKVSRTDSIPEANMPLGIGANFQGNGAIWGASYGDANQQASTNAVIGTAVSVSTQNTHNDDAQGLTGVGSIEGTGTGDGIGGYLVGSRKTTTGSTNALEVRSSNFTAQDDNFLPTTASRTMGGWATAGGNAPSAVAWNVGFFSTAQPWHVGYGAVTNSVTDYFMYDNSGATNGILLTGASRTGFGMAIASGSGPLLVGEVAALSSSSLLEVTSASGTGRDPLARWGSAGASDPFSLRLNNGSGTVYFAFVSGGAGQFLTGTATGDTGIKVATAGKAWHVGGTTKVLTVDGGNQFGAFGHATAAQQSGTPVAATDLASVITLANFLRTTQLAYGWIA